MSESNFFSSGSLSDAIKKTKSSLGSGESNQFSTTTFSNDSFSSDAETEKDVILTETESTVETSVDSQIDVQEKEENNSIIESDNVSVVSEDPFSFIKSDAVQSSNVDGDVMLTTDEIEGFGSLLQANNEEVLLEPVSQAKKAYDILKSMEGWQLSINKNGYIRIKNSLISFVRELERVLNEEKNNYTKQCTELTSTHNACLSKLRYNLLERPNSEAEEEFKNLVSNMNQSWVGPEGLKTTTETAISNYQFLFRDDSIVHTVISKIVASKDKLEIDSMSQQITAIRSAMPNIEAKMKAVVDAANRVKMAKLALYKKQYNNAIEEENSNYKNKMELLDSQYKNTVENIVNSLVPIFRDVLSRNNFATYSNIAIETISDGVNYTYSTKIPKSMYLGKRSFEISCETEVFFPEIVTMFNMIKHPSVSVSNKSFVFTLPYVHTMEEGYSIFIESQNSSAEFSKNLVKSYIMKIFMNYPAGQTRTLILDSDTEITCFGKIGENSRKGLITRPWSKIEDIESEITKISDEKDNLSVSYGEDIEARLRREPLYFVAARNFPKSFSNKAILQLSKVFISGAANGFFGIVEVDSKELATRISDKNIESSIREITSNSFCLKEISNGSLVVNDGSNDRFEFDVQQLPLIHDTSVVSSIINGIISSSREIEKFEYLFSKDAGNVEGTNVDDFNTWFRASAASNFEVPIGIRGASTVQKYVIEGIAQHGLISGITGSGKSSLLRTMILASMIKYTPDEVNFYLIDYKEGVEFAAFANYRLPWIKVIALDTKREFALNILKDLEVEFKRRADEMKDTTSTRVDQLGRKKFPRTILIFDEVQELLRENDKITADCIKILAKLVSEGRAMNMNVILASQDFSNCNGMSQIMANMANRIAFKGSPASAKMIMGDDFSVSQLENGGNGYAAINSASGANGKTNFFQAGYLDEDNRNELLAKLEMTMKSRECNTRVMSGRVNQDRNNKFNRLISNGEVDYTKTTDCYDLIIGDEFSIGSNKSISMSTKEAENMIIVGEDENIAKSVFSLTMLSVLYDELASKAHRIDNELIRIIDLSDENLPNYDYFEFLKSEFPRQINTVNLLGCNNMIEDTYENLISRKRGDIDPNERLFFMLFGIDAVTNLRQELFTDDDNELSLPQKLERILKDGPQYGINCIIWVHSYSSFKKIVSPSSAEKYIGKRMFYGGDEDDCDSLLGKKPLKSVIDNEAVMFKNVSSLSVSIVRPYSIPKKEWVMKISETYREFEKNMNQEEENNNE